MEDLKKQLKSALGTVGFFALMKILRRIEIRIEPKDKTLIIYPDGHEEISVGFDDIEDFVNNQHG